jgi:hypothetical protein
MEYFNLHLESIEIPFEEAEAKAKRGRTWQSDPVKSIYLKIQYAKNGIPVYCVDSGDNDEGLKYMVFINYGELGNALAPLTREMKKLGTSSWLDYMVGEIDKNPVFADSETTFAYDWVGRSVIIWTTDRNNYSLLRAECSKAIVQLAPFPVKKFDAAASKALVDKKGLNSFVKKIRENAEAMGQYQNLHTAIDAIMEKYPAPDLLPLLSALAGVNEFSNSLKELFAKYKMDEHLKKHPEEHEKLFVSLQENMKDAYILGLHGLATKEYLSYHIRLLTNALDTFGYGIYPKGIETIIRLFENDAVEGISIETYKTVIDYNAEDYGYYDGIENEKYYKKLWKEIDIANVGARNEVNPEPANKTLK